MKPILMLSTLVALGAQSALADVKLIGPVSVTNGLSAWTESVKSKVKALNDQDKYPATGYMECGEISEIKNAYICVSDTDQNMNQAFVRISLFAEGGLDAPRGVPISHGDRRIREGLKSTYGNDLKSSDLLDFYRKAQESCKKDSDTCLNAQETEVFSSLILPLASTTSDFAVITFSLDSDPYQGAVSHEVCHAQYFMQPKYREVVDNFWANSMTESEHHQVIRYLSGAYDTSYDYLMRNEFQAYLLMSDADDGPLSPLLPRLQEKLLRDMKAAGVGPLQIN
jgi:hypothetical protein